MKGNFNKKRKKYIDIKSNLIYSLIYKGEKMKKENDRIKKGIRRFSWDKLYVANVFEIIGHTPLPGYRAIL